MRDPLGAMPARRTRINHLGLLIAIIVLLSPGPGAGAQDVPPSLIAAIRTSGKNPADSTLPSFQYALIDLNGDARPDAIVLFGGDYCGMGGCTMAVFRATDRGFKLLSSSTIVNQPIRISPEERYGWKTLIVTAKRVGNALMRFNGARYPLNPSTQPRASGSQVAAANTLKLRPGHGA